MLYHKPLLAHMHTHALCWLSRAQGYVDVATFSDLAASTGGTLYQYTPFNAAMDHDLVLNDLRWNLVRSACVLSGSGF